MIGRGSTIITSTREESLGNELRIHGQIIWALLQREVRARFGKDSMAFATSYLAPLVWIAAVYLAFLLFGRVTPVHTDIITFIMSGLMPYAAFRYVMTAIGKTQSSVRGLLIFPRVTQEHAIVAAALLELFNTFVFITLVWVGNLLVFGKGEMNDLSTFLFGILLAWMLGASFAYLFAGLARINTSFWQFGQLLLRPMFFLSGIFYTANELPERLYDFLGWNPLLHAVDIARSGLLLNYHSRVAEAGYPLLWIAGMLVAGALVSAAQRR